MTGRTMVLAALLVGASIASTATRDAGACATISPQEEYLKNARWLA